MQRIGRTVLEDLSQGGVGIKMDHAIPIGQKVYLQNRYISCAGKVCYCARGELGYKIGLQFAQHIAPTVIRMSKEETGTR